ncbi:hypothetical protein [Vibrio mediterranei]|uniref:Uncharacterized protein n=1 Tax=Vibrio mediterranei TaxID=689 RepID=A0ABX5DBP2_9VIBR|nr:hypothetical protein [Vibrio mediterranei]PCD87844.1 hypothetical protein COR52_13885 [Vibrio mediterranei]PRQ67109.1 hypothetical protein COR51_13340 [Vibrio mediterranei]
MGDFIINSRHTVTEISIIIVCFLFSSLSYAGNINDESKSKNITSQEEVAPVSEIEQRLKKFQKRSIENQILIKGIEQNIEIKRLQLEQKKILEQLKKTSKQESIKGSVRVKNNNSIKTTESPKTSNYEITLSTIYVIDGTTYADFLNRSNGARFSGIKPNRIFGGGYSYVVSSNGTVELRYRK